jgi:hypothetical protein
MCIDISNELPELESTPIEDVEIELLLMLVKEANTKRKLPTE